MSDKERAVHQALSLLSNAFNLDFLVSVVGDRYGISTTANTLMQGETGKRFAAFIQRKLDEALRTDEARVLYFAARREEAEGVIAQAEEVLRTLDAEGG